MFENGLPDYSKQEVDKAIKKLRAEYEAKLMEEKLKVLEAEKKVLEYKNRSYEVENREKNIMSALDMFKRYQDEGRDNIDALRLEQLKMVQSNMILVFKELSLKYSGIEENKSVQKLLKDMNTILKQPSLRRDMNSPTNTENDSMRMLLNKLQGTRREGSAQPKEVKISREKAEIREPKVKPVYEGKNQIKPITEMTLNEGDKYQTLSDKFLSTRPENDENKINGAEIQSNGFDLKEAVTPKDDLAEIMKAFDFFDSGNEN